MLRPNRPEYRIRLNSFRLYHANARALERFGRSKRSNRFKPLKQSTLGLLRSMPFVKLSDRMIATFHC